MEYYEKGRTKIEGKEKIKKRNKKINKEVLSNGTIVFCKGSRRSRRFYRNSI